MFMASQDSLLFRSRPNFVAICPDFLVETSSAIASRWAGILQPSLVNEENVPMVYVAKRSCHWYY